MQIGRLLVHRLSPTVPLSDRKEALEFVFDAKHLDILKESLSPSLEVSDGCSGCMSLTVTLYVIDLCVLQREWKIFPCPQEGFDVTFNKAVSVFLQSGEK